MNEEEKEGASLGEKISLKFRKKFLVSKAITILIIGILVATYVALNLMLTDIELPQFDVTEYKIYTLSDASKDAIKKLKDKEIKIYTYGYEENSQFIKFLKQYNEVNEAITYEIINDESGKDLVTKYGLEPGNVVVIMQSGDSEKVIDSSEFSSYDYTTYQAIDITEQTLTNSILALAEENKPTVYFVEGHDEVESDLLGVLKGYLQNEAFNVNTLNILSTGKIPDDCNILAIMSPKKDLLESEVAAVKEYINRGGNIYFSQDLLEQGTTFPNFQSILDEYGVSIENGYIMENSTDNSTGIPFIFYPTVSSSHQITEDIALSGQKILLIDTGRLNFKTDDELKALGVEKNVLLTSSEDSSFTTDLAADLETAQKNAQVGSSNIAAILTKEINPTTEGEEQKQDSVKSELVIIANGVYIEDVVYPALDSQYPLSYMGSNKDFALNAFSYLGKKENILTIRKDMSSSTYTPTATENRIVVAIITLVPILIIVIGLLIWGRRRKM